MQKFPGKTIQHTVQEGHFQYLQEKEIIQFIRAAQKLWWLLQDLI